jgi:hypothetical protein
MEKPAVAGGTAGLYLKSDNADYWVAFYISTPASSKAAPTSTPFRQLLQMRKAMLQMQE